MRRDPEAVARFVERFAAVLVESGIPRMPARVFVALMTSDSGRLTAAELAEQLQISPAAVSGAVRYLVPVNLVSREREPGSRRDVYVVHDEVFYEATIRRDQVLRRWEDRLAEGLAVLGSATPAGHRLAETLEFFRFVDREMVGMQARWEEHRATLRNPDVQEAG
jgi:DNA-binding transcriptional regulator GbsR (MarR family)